MARSLFIASDHAGFDLKEFLKENLKEFFKQLGISVQDLGAHSSDRVDYPDYAQSVVKEVLSNSNAVGILICGSGQGMAIAANRHRGIRAALAMNDESARLARCHNNANILCLGARLTAPAQAAKLVEIFLTTEFEGGRHIGRLAKLDL